MLTKRSIVIVAFVAVSGVATFAFRTVTATWTAASSQSAVSVDSPRRPSGEAPLVINGANLDDYALRHPDARIVIPANLELSDYGLRHPNMRIDDVPSATDKSDYGLRHPNARIELPSSDSLDDAAQNPVLFSH